MSRRDGDATLSTFAVVALFVVALLFFALYLPKLYRSIDSSFGSRETCRLSAEGYAALQYRVNNVDVAPQTIDFDCQRRLITIKKDHIELNGKSVSFWDGRQNLSVKKYDAATPETVDAIVADELAGCFYQYLDGKVDLFGENVLIPERTCAICSEITFDAKDFPASVTFSLPLKDQLDTMTLRRGYAAAQPTFHDYFITAQTPVTVADGLSTKSLSSVEFYGNWSEGLPRSFSSGHKYIVYFRVIKMAKAQTLGFKYRNIYTAHVRDAADLNSDVCQSYFAG